MCLCRVINQVGGCEWQLYIKTYTSQLLRAPQLSVTIAIMERLCKILSIRDIRVVDRLLV